MILPIILHHNTSAEYTRQLKRRLHEMDIIIYDSSANKTQFTQSFNNAIEIFKNKQVKNPEYTHVMICNNDIDLNTHQVGELEKTIGHASGIFTPVVNSPHGKVMSLQSYQEIDAVPWIEFICPIIAIDVLYYVGSLDQRIALGWGIELDYCYRAKLAGYRSFVVNNVSVHHFEHKSQEDYQEYSRKAKIEMNHILEFKYGKDWQSVLEYP